MNMNSQKVPQKALEDIKVNVKLKLAALWASFMFLYIYVDYFALYMPGKIEGILAGKIFIFDISYVFLLIALISVTIPALMIFLSVALPAKVSRWANIIIAAVYIPYTLFNLTGEAWVHMVFGAVVEVALLLLIISYAWKWHRKSNNHRGQRGKDQSCSHINKFSPSFSFHCPGLVSLPYRPGHFGACTKAWAA
jgi:hypothetical protein